MENQNPSPKEQYEQKRQQKEKARSSQQPRKKSGLLWLVVIAIIAIAVYAMIKAGTNGDSEPITIPNDSVTATDHVKGTPTAPVVLIEYSDFQCPACKTYEPLISEALESVGDKVAFVYRHFPLNRIHPNAEDAAWASEAAALQNAFWPMHDMLFNRQSDWSDISNPKELFIEYAQSLELDTVKFETDYESDAVKERVDNDLRAATLARLNATPTFFLNGIQIQPPRSTQELIQIINTAHNIISNQQPTSTPATTTNATSS